MIKLYDDAEIEAARKATQAHNRREQRKRKKLKDLTFQEQKEIRRETCTVAEALRLKAVLENRFTVLLAPHMQEFFNQTGLYIEKLHLSYAISAQAGMVGVVRIEAPL